MADIEYGSARLKGIEFEVQPVTNSGGRRILTHVYPFANQHYNENLGALPEEWSVKGAFVGEDARDKLQLAKRIWQENSDAAFFEPTENKEHAVTIKRWSFDYDPTRLNYVAFDVELVARSDQPYPTSDPAGAAASLSRIQQFIEDVEQAYETVMGVLDDANAVINGFNSAVDFVYNTARQFISTGFGAINQIIIGLGGSKFASTNFASAAAPFESAADIDAPTGFFRQISEVRIAGSPEEELQGQLFASLGLAYYAERIVEGASFAELQEFRQRAQSLKGQLEQSADSAGTVEARRAIERVNNGIDSLIISIGSTAAHIDLVTLQEQDHALTASYRQFGNVSQAYDILKLSGGVSGAQLEQVVYAPDNASL